MNRLNIASFAYRSYPAKGGVEYMQQLVTDYFSAKNNKVTVYTSRHSSNEEFLNIDFSFPFIKLPRIKPTLKRIETINRVVYKRFDIRLRFYNYNYMKGLYEEFKNDLMNYDLVHLHGLNTYNNYRLAKIAYRKGIPVIMSCYDISIAPNFPIITKIFKKIYDTLFIKNLGKYVSVFLVLTKDQVKELSDLGIPKSKIRVWNVGLDIHKRKKTSNEAQILRKYGLKSKGYIFNFGRIEEYKGTQDVVEVAKHHPSITFVIAGKDDGYASKLKNIILKEKISNARYIGQVDSNTENVLLKNAKFFLFPSKKEGWGIVSAEAMSLGVPCIAYNISNVRTVFTNGMSGFLVKDISEMTEKTGILIKDGKLLNKFSKNALKESEKYDYHNTLPKLEKIYDGYRKIRGDDQQNK